MPLVAPLLLENERLPEHPLCLPQLSNYQNICASGAYKGFSQEELRLQHYKEDYEAGMRTLDSNAVTTAVTTGRFWNLALAIQAEVEGFSSPCTQCTSMSTHEDLEFLDGGRKGDCSIV